MGLTRSGVVRVIILCGLVTLLLHLTGRMIVDEEGFRHPAIIPESLVATHKGLSTERSTTKENASSASVKQLDPTPGKPKMVSPVTPKQNISSKSKFPKRTKYLFNISDYKPGKQSKPLLYGVYAALAQLNDEFSETENIVKQLKSLKVKSKVPNFDKSKAHKMGIVGNYSVGDIIPPEVARKTLILTTWRSGSTFLGDLLNHYPGTFYYFEPLHYFDKTKKKSKSQNQTSFLKSLYSCQFGQKNIGYLQHVAKHNNTFLFQNHNFRLWNSCRNILPQSTMCFMPEFLNHVCPMYPIKLIKTVRLRLHSVEELLKDLSLDLKVIFLVRDPRGVYNSRSSGPVSAWCSGDQCANPVTGCKDLSSDIKSAFNLERKYPGTVSLVRYEDLSMEPEVEARKIMNFLNLPWTGAMASFIASHTSKEKLKKVRNKKTKKVESKYDPYGTSRNSTATAFAWREKLPFVRIDAIQSACSDPMDLLGYKLIKKKKELEMWDLPIKKTAQEVWPFPGKETL
eukprot:GFUD01003795.1.p1 GENE.GFUD01003795.1~~GFUD01003795.1.p1  ORF type:complete len:511 (+),score=108.02 GFUD01003795.1:67-1599(+)